MNVILVDVFGPAGAIGRFGFYSVPRVGEEIQFPGGRATVRRVLHVADPTPDRTPAPPIRIEVA